jgi:nucleoside-diphosphate-sugar epimerase
MNSILVTGSSGFIGRKVVEKLPKLGVITDYDNSIRVNLENIEEVMKINSADTVIHLAGKTPKKELKWNDYFSNNISSTLNILEYCVKKNVKKLIYVSNYIYGNPKYSPIDENHPINPHNAYSESKYLAERLCKFYCDKTNLNLIILRPFNIYGESMNEGFLLSNLINSVKTNEKLTIINKDSRRDLLHVDDFVDLILKIKDYNCKFEIFNVGTGISSSFNEIIEKIEKITLKKLDLEYLEDKKIFIEDIKADITKIKEKLDWKPRVGIEEGLQRMLKSN